MFRMMTAALLLFAQTAAASASTACAGADPTIVSVAVKGVNSEGGLNRYKLSGTVVNVGRMAQASNVLQFVDIYEVGGKLDAKGIPPLKPGQSYTFSYVVSRSRDAGKGTTELAFQLDVRQPSPPGSQDCNADNDRFTLSF
jgi:hypothetical protein